MKHQDLLTEDLIPLNEIRKHLPKQDPPKRPSLNTIWRWINRGLGGVKLESVKIGSKTFTTKQAVARFTTAAFSNPTK